MTKLEMLLEKFEGNTRAQDAIRSAYNIGLEEARHGRKQEVSLIEHMLSECEDALEGNDFIASLRNQYDERGTLSPKQTQALRNFYERI